MKFDSNPSEGKMNFCIKLIIICSFINSIGSNPELGFDNVVNIPTLGIVKGTTGTTYFTGRNISLFYGINYAKSPSGNSRFSPPQPYGRWLGIYDATKMRQRCPQPDMKYYPSPDPDWINPTDDIEDCLVVNIFSPNVSRNAKLPVMFYIHGGSFVSGSAYDFQPGFLLEEDIILVVPQYRLGVLGFLSLETDEVPGNMGMLDILLALQWVKKNILYFGGDPSNIAVVGQSAGAAAASSLLISPLVEPDLFHKMIIQSGSVLGPWVLEENPIESASILARLVNCPNDNIQEMTECMKNKPALELINAQDKILSDDLAIGKLSSVGRGMVVQKLKNHNFLVETPQEAFERPRIRVPILGGVTRDEGSSFFIPFYDQLTKWDIRDGYLERNVTRDILQSQGFSDPHGMLTDLYHNLFFKAGTNQTLTEMLPGFVDLLGTIMLKQSTYQVLRIMSYSNPSYAYSFNFYGGISKVRASVPDWELLYPFPTGVAHSDELGYLFPDARSNYRDRELNMVKIMTKFWTNFVKYGSPNGIGKTEWPKMSTPFGPYLKLTDNWNVGENVQDQYPVNTREGFIHSAASTSANCLASIMILSLALMLTL